jgi:hypothetical protein
MARRAGYFGLLSLRTSSSKTGQISSVLLPVRISRRGAGKKEYQNLPLPVRRNRVGELKKKSTKTYHTYYLRITLIREPGKPAHFGLQRDKPPRRLLDCVDLRTKANKVKIPVFACLCLMPTKRIGLPSSQPSCRRMRQQWRSRLLLITQQLILGQA